jgi:hypothetical protein
MAEKERPSGCRLWVSYPWANQQERNFAYVASQLAGIKFEGIYDELHVQPGVGGSLAQRIILRLLSSNCRGWLYILTREFLRRRECTDQLIAAMDETLQHMGHDFPIVGLLHGISPEQAPPVLRVRPCLSLGDPGWTRGVLQALDRAAVSSSKKVCRETRFEWHTHPCYGGDPALTAIEVRAKYDSLQYWRFALPASVSAVRWGVGAAGGGDISPLKFAVATGSGIFAGARLVWFGAANAVTNSESAYVVFSGRLPDFVCFGPAETPAGHPGPMEIFSIPRNR